MPYMNHNTGVYFALAEPLTRLEGTIKYFAALSDTLCKEEIEGIEEDMLSLLREVRNIKTTEREKEFEREEEGK